MSLISRIIAFFRKQAQNYERELLTFFPSPQPTQPAQEKAMNLKPGTYLWFDHELSFLFRIQTPNDDTILDIGRIIYRAYECLDDDDLDKILRKHRLAPSQIIRYCHKLVMACNADLAKHSEMAGGEA